MIYSKSSKEGENLPTKDIVYSKFSLEIKEFKLFREAKSEGVYHPWIWPVKKKKRLNWGVQLKWKDTRKQ